MSELRNYSRKGQGDKSVQGMCVCVSSLFCARVDISISQWFAKLYVDHIIKQSACHWKSEKKVFDAWKNTQSSTPQVPIPPWKLIPSVAALDQPQSFCVPSSSSTIILSISFCFVTSMPTRAGAILSLTFWTAWPWVPWVSQLQGGEESRTVIEKKNHHHHHHHHHAPGHYHPNILTS